MVKYKSLVPWCGADSKLLTLHLQLAGAPGSTPPLGQQLQLASQPFPGGSGGFGSFEGPFELTGAGPSSGGADQQLTLMAPAPVPGWAGFDGGYNPPSPLPPPRCPARPTQRPARLLFAALQLTHCAHGRVTQLQLVTFTWG